MLWGQSLRFGAVEAMYHPLVLALEGWLGEADEAERASVIKAVPGAALILPSLGASPAEGPSMLMLVVDALLSRVVARGPTVLVVDDVQWADPATWDALSYLVAGFAHQRLALVTTHRDEAAVSEHFQHWLGNVRRLPGTEELVLTRLDQDATGDQIAVLLGRRAASAVGGAGLRAVAGQPVLQRATRYDAATSTPPSCPTTCPTSSARRCSTRGAECRVRAREIARILAVAGRPTDLRTLAAIAAELGVSQAGSVREAVDAGVIVLDGDGVWFRHPLLAGVLAESYLPGEAAPVHAVWAAHLESVSDRGCRRAAPAGRPRVPPRACRRRVGGVRRPPPGRRPRREARRASRGRRPAGPRRRTCGRRVPTPPTPSATRSCSNAPALACFWVGRDARRLPICSARHATSSPPNATRSGRADSRRGWRGSSSASARPGTIHSSRFERAVELSRVEPDSREHAEALAWHAHALFWVERNEEARRVVEDAVAAADRSRSAAAISLVHGIRAGVLLESDFRLADADATVCWEQALASGEPWAIDTAHGTRLMIAYARGDLRRYHVHARDYYEWLVPQGETVYPGVVLAGVLLAMGDLVEAQDIVRVGLAGTGHPINEAMIRLLAGVLAARRGANDTALGHLVRAHEILPSLEERPEGMAGSPIAEMLLAQDGPAAAFELVERVLPLNTVDARVLDELMVLGRPGRGRPGPTSIGRPRPGRRSRPIGRP